jgi:hypothetical protein
MAEVTEDYNFRTYGQHTDRVSTHNALAFISAGCAYCSTASVPVGVAAVTRTSALRRCDSARILLLNSVSATVQVNPRCLQAQGARA